MTIRIPSREQANPNEVIGSNPIRFSSSVASRSDTKTFFASAYSAWGRPNAPIHKASARNANSVVSSSAIQLSRIPVASSIIVITQASGPRSSNHG